MIIFPSSFFNIYPLDRMFALLNTGGFTIAAISTPGMERLVMLVDPDTEFTICVGASPGAIRERLPQGVMGSLQRPTEEERRLLAEQGIRYAPIVQVTRNGEDVPNPDV